MRLYRLTIVWAALLLSMLSCSLTPEPDAETQSPTGVLAAPEVLFQDDFAKLESGWDQVRDQTSGITDYENGAYRMQVVSPRTIIWANPGLNLGDVQIEVEATKIGGSDDNEFGVLCRFLDNSNFYAFLISSDGYFGIFKIKDGQEALLGRTEMSPSEGIIQGNVTNHLRVECVGDRLTLTINGQLIDTQQDPDFTTGDIGLAAGAYDIPGTDILFDNLTVYKP